jgi:hypothetical protein
MLNSEEIADIVRRSVTIWWEDEDPRPVDRERMSSAMKRFWQDWWSAKPKPVAHYMAPGVGATIYRRYNIYIITGCVDGQCFIAVANVTERADR